MPSTLTHEATLHRTRLLLGLIPGADVVAWADARLAEMSAPSAALHDVSLTAPTDLSALRHALLPLAEARESRAVIETILREVASDLVSGRRNVHDTASVLRQMRLMLPLPALVDTELDEMIDVLMLADVGIGASVDEAETAVRKWARAVVP